MRRWNKDTISHLPNPRLIMWDNSSKNHKRFLRLDLLCWAEQITVFDLVQTNVVLMTFYHVTKDSSFSHRSAISYFWAWSTFLDSYCSFCSPVLRQVTWSVMHTMYIGRVQMPSVAWWWPINWCAYIDILQFPANSILYELQAAFSVVRVVYWRLCAHCLINRLLLWHYSCHWLQPNFYFFPVDKSLP